MLECPDDHLKFSRLHLNLLPVSEVLVLVTALHVLLYILFLISGVQVYYTLQV